VWTFGDKLDPAFDAYTVLGGDFRGGDPAASSASAYGDRPFNGHFAIGLRLVRREAGLAKPPQSVPVSVPRWVVGRGTVTAPDATRQLVAPLAERWLETVDIPGKPYAFGKFEVSYAKWMPVYDWACAHGYVFDNGGDMGSMASGGPVRSSPVAVGGVIYVGSYDGNVYAIDAASGAKRWAYATGGKVSGSAAVVSNVVYIASEAGSLYALDAATGAVKWRADGLQVCAGSPAVAYGKVFIGAGNKGGSDVLQMSAKALLAFDAATGESVWQGSAGPQGYAAIATDGERLYAGANGSTYASYSIADGKYIKTWQVGHPARSFVSLTVDGGKVYSPATLRGAVVCTDPDGKRSWMSATVDINQKSEMKCGGLFGYEIFTDLAVTADRIFAGCNDGKLYTLDKGTGAKGWTYATGGRVMSSPSVASNVVYFGSEDGNLYALNCATGEMLWKQTLGARIISSPWPGDGVVYVGCDDGNVYALH